MVSDKVRGLGFTAARMRHRYPWRLGATGAAAAAVGGALSVAGVENPALVLIPAGVALATATVGWWWLWWVPSSGPARTVARARALRRFPWRTTGVGVGAAGLGIAHQMAGWDPVLVLLPGGVLVVGAATSWWWLTQVIRPHSTRAAIGRRAELDQRHGGVATWLDIAERSGPAALRRKAGVLRPVTAAGLTRRAKRRLDPAQLGVQIARLGWGLPGQSVWSSVEDTTLRIAPPRAGKTISMACHAQDAPGALITTSTRLDLAEMVHAARAARGTVYFFNPSRMGGLATTLRWRVLSGCEQFGTAQRRAADLIPVSAVAEAERWDADARRILALLLHAAAVSGRGMRDVVRWNSDHSDTTQTEVTTALLGAGAGGRDRVDAMRQHWGTNDRTRTSVTAMMNAPLAWVRDEQIRPLADFPDGEPGQVDLADLILSNQTLHLLGRATQTGVAPLIAALVAEIAETARMLAEDRPGGRLDPPLTMVLDEIALVCPIPLDAWSADMGGKGVTIHAAVQSLSQLRQTWGNDGAGAILGNIGSLIIFGGSPSASDLRDLSQLTGEHRMRVVGVDHDRVDDSRDGELRGEYRWVPVLSPAQIRDLDPLQVLILKRDLHAVVGWTPKIIDRPDWTPTNLRPDHLPDTATTIRRPLVVQARRHATALLRAFTSPLRRRRTDPGAPATVRTRADQTRAGQGGAAPVTQPIPLPATPITDPIPGAGRWTRPGPGVVDLTTRRTPNGTTGATGNGATANGATGNGASSNGARANGTGRRTGGDQGGGRS